MDVVASKRTYPAAAAIVILDGTESCWLPLETATVIADAGVLVTVKVQVEEALLPNVAGPQLKD